MMSDPDSIALHHAWRVRFETPDGMFTFVDLRMENDNVLRRSEAEQWAQVAVKENPSRYARVAKVYAID